MRKVLLAVVVIVALRAHAEETMTITVTCDGPPCTNEAPRTQWDFALCLDYELDTALIEAAERGDRSAVELLQRRHASAVSWNERARIGGALLGKVADDSAIWKELETHAESYVRFSEKDETTRAKLEAFCKEHGYEDPDAYSLAAWDSFAAASRDRRARPLLLRAVESGERDVVSNGIISLAAQHDESALLAIEAAIRRSDSPVDLASLLVFYESEAVDRLALQFITDEYGRERYFAQRRQEP
ncbi:MAG TPA: hypothetical protein VJ276_18580 [Thermoanaerobaculia bacterium]|nr:hypothetical protein [Thermoanaerobaculia bacterium]